MSATHVLWHESGWSFVDISKGHHDPENPNLQALPEGVHPHWAIVDPIERTVGFDPERLAAKLHADIDAIVGALRCRFITEVPGQQATYLRKEAKARDYLVSGDPADARSFTREAAARDLTLEAMAQAILAIADDWNPKADVLEDLRVSTKVLVSLGTTAAEMIAAAQVDWEALLAPEEE